MFNSREAIKIGYTGIGSKSLGAEYNIRPSRKEIAEAKRRRDEKKGSLKGLSEKELEKEIQRLFLLDINQKISQFGSDSFPLKEFGQSKITLYKDHSSVKKFSKPIVLGKLSKKARKTAVKWIYYLIH